MVAQNFQANLFKQPQNSQSDMIFGIYKGRIVDVRDPMSLGRVRVWSYPLYGDAVNINVDCIPWAEVVHNGRTPELWDGAWLSFESGDRYAPIVLGSWKCNPVGRGTLPYSTKVGSELRPEGFANRNLYPESEVVSADGPGNVISTHARYLDQNSLASDIISEDTGGKRISISSFHTNAKPYTPVDEVPGGLGALVGLTSANKPCSPIRDGFSTVQTTTAGSIELFTQGLAKYMLSSATTFSHDIMTQGGSSGIGVDQQSVNGDISRIRQDNSSVTLFDNTLALQAINGVLMANSFNPPRRYDK